MAATRFTKLSRVFLAGGVLLIAASLLLSVTQAKAETEQGTTPQPDEPIDVPAYMPLNVGDVFTYDDGSRAEITRTVELDWLDNVTAYEKVWTVNPNPAMTDVRYNFISRGDSLFWASLHFAFDSVYYLKNDPPMLMGTANTTPGDTFSTNTMGITFDDAGMSRVYPAIVHVVVNRSGPVSVPYGTFEDCITMKFIEVHLDDGEKEEFMNLVLAKGIGIIQGNEVGIASESAPVHSLVDYQPGTTPEPDEPIDVPAYMPFNIGDVFTYDDGARAEITRTVELDWLDNVTAYEKVWTVNPNPQMTDARGYYIISGDSLFLASLHGTSGGVADHAKFDPPVLLGTANTTPGDTLTTVGIVHGVVESSGLPEVDSSIVQVVVDRSGPVSVPYGTLEDCIAMTITLSFIYEELTLELKNVILAKGIGIIYGREEGIATESAPVHSMADFQQGTTPPPDEPIDVFAYMPLNIGDVFTYDDGARAEITRTVELDWLDNVTAYEQVWTINPNPQVTDLRYYYIISGDSLFAASIHYTYEGVSDYFRYDPPTLLGTANTTPGDTLTTVSVAYTAGSIPGEPHTAFTTQVVLNWSDPVSVPYGTFEDCITLTYIEVDDGEKNETSKLILAKGIGIIHGDETGIATDLAPVHSLVDFQPGTTPQPDEPIDVPAYMPLNVGDVFTYDDGSRAEITRTVELDWLDNVTAYEKVWTINPNPEMTDVRYYFIIRGDSLFWASVHLTHDNIADYARFDPPALMGTANTIAGDTLTTVRITYYGVEEDTGLPNVEDDSTIVQVVVNRSGPVSVPYGTFEDCITMTVILMPSDEEKTEILNVTLAKGIGIIQGAELLIATESAPVHSLSDFQPGTTPQPDEPIDVPAYMPFNIGDVFTYDDGSRAEITRTVELDWLDNATAYEKVWTVNPNPQITDVRYYFISRGDSLFLASLHFIHDGISDYAKLEPPILMGTANTTPGDTLNTVGTRNEIDDATGLPGIYPSFLQVIVNRSGPVNVPSGTFEDCIGMIFLEEEDGEMVEVINLILAKGIGVIQGSEWGIASELAPVHSMTDFQPGVTPVDAPDISLSIISIDMGEVTFGSQATASFSITNSGNAPLAIDSITSD
ncbi:MAG: hypothetical protein FVQ81_10600, partial [Candidatus Glassbacteria bacterium]|nr:hypothetical protein [Candidatus Glassbacteria bacterium]